MTMFKKTNGLNANQLNPECVYLNTRSSIHQIIKPDVVENNWDVKKKLWFHFSVYTTETNLKAEFGTLKVLFNKCAISNIVSFDKVEKVYPFTYDYVNQLFVLNIKGIGSKDGRNLFKWGKEGFTHCDLPDHKNNVIIVNTIGEKFEGFTKAKVKRYCNALKALDRLVDPTERDFKQKERANLIPNFPVTPKEITKACIFFGPD